MPRPRSRPKDRGRTEAGRERRLGHCCLSSVHGKGPARAAGRAKPDAAPCAPGPPGRLRAATGPRLRQPAAWPRAFSGSGGCARNCPGSLRPYPPLRGDGWGLLATRPGAESWPLPFHPWYFCAQRPVSSRGSADWMAGVAQGRRAQPGAADWAEAWPAVRRARGLCQARSGSGANALPWVNPAHSRASVSPVKWR